MKYQALLVSYDGDYVTDFEGKTINEVLEQLVNRGSYWWFFPFEFIIKNPLKNLNGRIIDAPIKVFKNKRIKTVLEAFKKTYKEYKNQNIEAEIYLNLVANEIRKNYKGGIKNENY